MWDSRSHALLWADLFVGIIHEARLDEHGKWRETRRRTLGRHIGAVVPRGRGGYIVASGLEILSLDDAGNIATFARLQGGEKVSANDAKCDSRGRLWVGTYATDLHPGRGALYRVDPDGSARVMLGNVTISNGLDWSPDGETLYYIDSYARRVDRFDFDSQRGDICNRQTLISFAPGDGAPDGMTVDREGFLWVAVVGTGEVRRYSPDGSPVGGVKIPAPIVASCAFGGVDGGELFITSGSIRLSDDFLPVIGFDAQQAERAAKAPGAGGLFVHRPGTSGVPAHAFAG
jgi:sugar lactone lactonase YvrE